MNFCRIGVTNVKIPLGDNMTQGIIPSFNIRGMHMVNVATISDPKGIQSFMWMRCILKGIVTTTPFALTQYDQNHTFGHNNQPFMIHSTNPYILG